MRYIGPMMRQKAIKDLDQRAVYLFGMTADVPMIVGNRHYHPHRLGTTKQPGNLNRSYKSSFPVAGASMVQIWWCVGPLAAGRLITDVELALQEADIERMHGTWWNVPRGLFENTVLEVARRSKIRLQLSSEREAQIAREVGKAMDV